MPEQITTNLNLTNQILVLISLVSLLAFACKKEPSVAPPSLVDTLITSERQLAGGQEPAVSPDGKSIAYTFNGNIYVMDTSGANQKQLTSGTTDILPRWRPDGSAIGFVRSSRNFYNQGVIYTVPSGGGGASQLIFGEFVGDSLDGVSRAWGGVAEPIWDWSPDGKYIAFLQVNGLKAFIKVVAVTNSQEIYSAQTYYYRKSILNNLSSFQWSYNQNEIAYVASNPNLYGFEAVCLLNLSDSTLIQDTTYNQPSFLTKNNTLQEFAFTSANHMGYEGISASDLLSGATQFYSNIYDGGGLKWSPDDKYFLYEYEQIVGGAGGYDYSTLFLYSLERSKQYQLTFTGDIITPHDFFFRMGKERQYCLF